ncbi:MAG: hypothetical protein LUD68_00460, partial [Rikenellaceae bacterium]|nr:hypothetical protein [Rikenellaceae bacterium]
VMYSCQSDGNDSYYFEEEELTAADLFVASEAYQHMRSQLQKDSRATAAILSGLSGSDRAEFRRLSDLISY